jgi:hypothetical protein
MAGGIFPGRPFAWNIKCIIFTILIAGGYWYLPHRNKYVLIFLLWIPYLALAWYDYYYDCKDKMMPTLFPYGRKIYLPFKPPDYKREFEKMPETQIKAMDRLDHIVTWSIFIVIIGAVIVKMYRK